MEETVPVRPRLKDNALLGCRSEESENKRASKESGENEKDQEVTDREQIKEDEEYQRESAGDVGIVSGEGKGLSQSESDERGRSDLPEDPGVCAPCGGVGPEEEGEDG